MRSTTRRFLVGQLLALAALAFLAQMATGQTVSATAGSPNPNPVASGQTATSALNATATPPTVSYPATLSGPTWTWSVDGSPAGNVSINEPDPSSPAATLSATFSSPGSYAVTATATATWTVSSGGVITCSGTTNAVTFQVVGVLKLQYLQNGTGIDVSGTLYVLVGKSVTFKAIPTPSGVGWPAGQPVWSGSSGASGTGDTVTVTFPTTPSSSLSDYKTVVATCGNTQATANVIVFDLTPIMTPQDNYDGRDLSTYGVCELINLSYSTIPSGISASAIGGLQWEIASGGGTLTGGANGVGTYECPDVASFVILDILVTGGPMLGQKKAEDPKEIVPPTGALLEQYPKSTIFHVNKTCSVGFAARLYVTGKNVSFKQIQMQEGTCKATATGYYKTIGQDGDVHDKGDWISIGDLVKDKGFLVGGNDTWDEVANPYETPMVTAYAVGTFVWNIPWSYKKTGAADTTAKEFTTVKHNGASDAAGKASVDKGGSPVFSAAAADATSGYGL